MDHASASGSSCERAARSTHRQDEVVEHRAGREADREVAERVADGEDAQALGGHLQKRPAITRESEHCSGGIEDVGAGHASCAKDDAISFVKMCEGQESWATSCPSRRTCAKDTNRVCGIGGEDMCAGHESHPWDWRRCAHGGLPGLAAEAVLGLECLRLRQVRRTLRLQPGVPSARAIPAPPCRGRGQGRGRR